MTSIGEILVEARLKNGLTVKDVEKSIKIRAKYISALEQNDFEIIPGRAYVIGFIKTYANFLNLDSSDLISRYREEFEGEPQKQLYIPVEPQRRKFNVTVPVRLLILVIIILALIGLAKMVGLTFKQENVSENGKSVKKAEKSSNTSAAEPAKAENLDITIRVKQSGGSWILVIVDGNKEFEGELKEGEKNWKAKREIMIRAGNAKAIEIIKNGKNLGLFDPAKTVVEKSYKIDE